MTRGKKSQEMKEYWSGVKTLSEIRQTSDASTRRAMKYIKERSEKV